MNDPSNPLNLLADATDEELLAMFFPSEDENARLDQELAIAQAMGGQPYQRYNNPWASALGNLGTAVTNVNSAYQQRKALDEKQALGRTKQEDAAKRMRLLRALSGEDRGADGLRRPAMDDETLAAMMGGY